MVSFQCDVCTARVYRGVADGVVIIIDFGALQF